MKEVTSTLEASEINTCNRGVELYRVFNSLGDIGYFTDASEVVTYLGRDYLPASIKRSDLEFDSAIGTSKMKIQFVWHDESIRDFIAQNPTDIIWVEVLRSYLDLSPIEIRVIFIGQVKLTGFTGLQAEAECVSLEHFLGMNIPNNSYQKLCNHFLFDTGCTIIASEWVHTATVTSFGSTRNIVNCSDMIVKEQDYYTYGHILGRGTKRMISMYSAYATGFTLFFSIPSLEIGDTIAIYPGCDRTGSQCLSKFNNFSNFFGFEYIPFDNPTLWTA